METYEILRDLAIVLLSAKVFAVVAKHFRIPQVVGQILAGLLIGPCVLGVVEQTSFLSQMAEIGVILLMFETGLGTNLKELIKTGPKATLIACCGVAVPLLGGTLLYMAFYGPQAVGTEGFYKAIFIGCILTATSVGITVEALRELGYIKGYVGQTILSAAIIDDVIGIIVLTFVMGCKDPSVNPGSVILKTVVFFVLAVVLGVVCYKIFDKIDKRYPHTRRIPIASVGFCFLLSYVAEKYFGIADITGAYVAGIILCNISDADYVARKTNISSYMFFGPIFFACIGIKTDLSTMNMGLLLFSIAFVVVALLTKIIGCGLISKVCGFKWSECMKIGVGMMTRGEVALIISSKGLEAGLMSEQYFAAVILLIIISSISTPLILKALYTKFPEQQVV
ncbi:MAG: cation:proton antiporter [Lachnospiraceae bacterium]|nr:cation:proton antiporter [Lachnospiraceae bacterium]